ncbi:MAG: DNA-deoxyinosine glycosylase [Rhodocyclaceae bacterium]|nr:DNA-deoxyinosine glycosylase [Rhodocyclaceae bacterium]
MTCLYGLPPIIDERARVLILGSFPSTASLAAQQYYAHRRNQFWPILSALLGQPLTAMDYAARQTTLRTAGLAVWDVYASCERVGSLDAAIRNGRPNDFAALRQRAPGLARICFNGREAARFAPQLAALGIAIEVLPSTSPANASWSFERKLAAWRKALATAS